jgi:hypothetical protein
MITDLMLLVACYLHFVMFMIFCVVQNAKQNLGQHLDSHPHLRALQESQRRQLLELKHGYNSAEVHLQNQLQAAAGRFLRLHADYDCITILYQDQGYLVQEYEDRIAYLERKLHESGQNTPTARQPYSAPASQVNFKAPPRRLRALSNVSILTPNYCDTAIDFGQVIEASEVA